MKEKSKKAIKKSGKYGPIIGSIVGIFPQCGFSVSATNLYAGRVITLGTLISVYLTTSDEMIPILISEAVSPIIIIKILAIKLVIGIIAGTFLYQIFTSIIMNLFSRAYQIEITFNLKAVGMTAIYFFGIFALVLLNCRRKIKKTKVYDLLYADKKNENNIIKNSKGNIIIFIISLFSFLFSPK